MTYATTERAMSTPERDQVRVLDEEGSAVEGATVPDLDDEVLVEMYRTMRLARLFDQRAVSLQRQGRMGTSPPLSGQEAARVGSAMALADDDWVVPSYREHAAVYLRDVGLERALQYWMGDERGSRHTGSNVLPAVCFCNDDQWAISVPREKQTASATLAQKAKHPDAATDAGRGGPVPPRRAHDGRRSVGLPRGGGGRTLEKEGPDRAAGDGPRRAWDPRRRASRGGDVRSRLRRTDRGTRRAGRTPRRAGRPLRRRDTTGVRARS